MASIPATNNLPIAVNNNSNDAQMNFNPSWMQSTAPPMQRSLSVSNNSTSSVNAKKMVTENDETCEPIFAKHSYGREDLLAMMGKNTMKPPLGIKRCPFYMDSAQTPIILMPFSDTEMRLQQNMNSSKAMSTKKKTFSRVESTTKSSDIWPRRTVGIGAGGVQQQQHVQAPQAPLPLKVVASTNNNFSSTANNLATAGANPPGTNNGGTGTSNGNKKASESATPTTAVAAMAKEPPSLATTKASAGETLPQTAPLSATAKATHHWCYLDPTGVQRGPFDSQQMQAWFSSGYFSETLRVRRKDETTYIALGDLFLINGREAPFVVKTVTSLPSQQQTATFPTVQQQRISPSELLEATTNATAAGQHHHHPHISPTLVDVERIWATTPLEDAVVGAGGGGGSAPASNGSTVTTAVAASAVGGGGGATAPMTMMQSKEFKILEEQRKLREKEELLRRNEIERAAKEQRVREMESELKRQQEELSRRACEKDAEFEQRRAQIAEYERNRRDELVAFEQRIRAEHLQRQLQLEEDDRRRAKEMEELLLIRREQERQHQLVEAEMKRKRDDEDVRLRLAFQEQKHQQELIKEKARRAEEEQRRRLIEEQQRHQQKALDEARAERTKQQQAAAKAEAAAKAMEQQRINSLANAQWQQQQPMVNSNSFSFNQPPPPQQPPIQPPSTQQQTRATAWQTISTPLPHPIGQSPPASFLQFPFQQEQQQPIAQQQPPAVTEQRRGWQPVQLPKAAPIPPAINKPSSGGGGGANTKLGNKNNKQGVKHPQKGGGKQQKQQMPPPVEDKFTAWIIKRVKELNPSVDAEVFATFISGIDSPNEAEDYIIGYLGENKEVKEFHRDFLQKRIELRPRAHPQAPKDDLSRPAAAHGADSELHKGAGWASGGCASGAMANSSGIGGAAAATTAVSNANKKKQKGQKVLDLSTLGFRPASDPNRLNAGEIDSVPPVPGGAGNKKR